MELFKHVILPTLLLFFIFLLISFSMPNMEETNNYKEGYEKGWNDGFEEGYEEALSNINYYDYANGNETLDEIIDFYFNEGYQEALIKYNIEE